MKALKVLSICLMVIPFVLGVGFWLYEMLTSDKTSDVCFGIGMTSVMVGIVLSMLTRNTQ